MMKEVFQAADILIPQKSADMQKWSVVACDQYTSDKKYWQQVEQTVGDAPSTLRITLPEIYLEEDGVDKRIEKINQTMKDYENNGVFQTLKNSYVYLERTMKDGRVRHGVMGVLELEEYDYNKGSGSLIRATEGTVLSRIPPRVRIRENAPLELPHIMILIDDADGTVIEPVAAEKNKLEKIYDFDLMQQSGHCAGYRIDGDSETAEKIQNGLAKLAQKEIFEKKYNVSDMPMLQFAVGDGNHSLATAKTCWEEKKDVLPADHPARYALVELVNLHDPSLEFEAIHRVVFDINPQSVVEALKTYYPEIEISDRPQNPAEKEHHFTIVTPTGDLYALLKNPPCNLSVGSLQKFLDAFLEENAGKIDYIHGEDAVRENVSETAIGFLLPTMTKDELFETVVKDGVLPRKTFSMGHAEDKRFYLEARKI